MDVTLACDHRILYGADAAQFLARIRALLEEPLARALGSANEVGGGTKLGGRKPLGALDGGAGLRVEDRVFSGDRGAQCGEGLAVVQVLVGGDGLAVLISSEGPSLWLIVAPSGCLYTSIQTGEQAFVSAVTL